MAEILNFDTDAIEQRRLQREQNRITEENTNLIRRFRLKLASSGRIPNRGIPFLGEDVQPDGTRDFSLFHGVRLATYLRDPEDDSVTPQYYRTGVYLSQDGRWVEGHYTHEYPNTPSRWNYVTDELLAANKEVITRLIMELYVLEAQPSTEEAGSVSSEGVSWTSSGTLLEFRLPEGPDSTE